MGLVEHSIEGGVGTVVLNDPGRRNALTPQTAAEVVAAMTRLESDADVRAIVVTGAGTAFCAGADLSVLERAGEADLRSLYQAFLRVARSPLPTIAAVNGPAVGAGLNLALVCDVRLAAESARFDARFLRLGVHPGGGSTWLLHRLVGPATSAAMMLFGEVLDGAAAARLGLAYECVADDALMALARTLAGRLAQTPRELVVRTKATMAATALLPDHEAAVERELVQQLWSLHQPEFRPRLTRPDGAS